MNQIKNKEKKNDRNKNKKSKNGTKYTASTKV